MGGGGVQFHNFNGNVLICLLEKTAMQKMFHKKNIRLDMTDVRILRFVFDWPPSDIIHATPGTDLHRTQI
jgi:hypothetical protein